MFGIACHWRWKMAIFGLFSSFCHAIGDGLTVEVWKSWFFFLTMKILVSKLTFFEDKIYKWLLNFTPFDTLLIEFSKVSLLSLTFISIIQFGTAINFIVKIKIFVNTTFSQKVITKSCGMNFVMRQKWFFAINTLLIESETLKCNT